MIYTAVHKSILEDDGWKYNPYLLPLVFTWCVHCKQYRHFDGYSKERDSRGRHIWKEAQVCRECGLSTSVEFQDANQLCLPF
jgi:hypothetical protein